MDRRQRRHEDHQNHEAWAIPYADLLTLLLAFFVVMYAISSVNEGKYRQLSDALNLAFNGSQGSPMPLHMDDRGPVATRAAALDFDFSEVTSPSLPRKRGFGIWIEEECLDVLPGGPTFSLGDVALVPGSKVFPPNGRSGQRILASVGHLKAKPV